LLAHPAPGLIPFSQSMPTFAKIIFVVALALSFTGLFSPPIALTGGILFLCEVGFCESLLEFHRALFFLFFDGRCSERGLRRGGL